MSNKIKESPTLTDILREFKISTLASLNCIKIGRIEKFNQTKKTAEIQILFKRILPDKVVSYPLLIDCPVVTLQGGTGSIRLPIKSGDTCLVFFSDRNIDIWFSNGAESAPANLRCHDLSDGIALVGINYEKSDLPNYDENINITIPTSKKLVVSGTTATAEILGTAALALLSELSSLISTFNSHIHTVAAAPGNTSAPTIAASSATGTTKLKGS